MHFDVIGFTLISVTEQTALSLQEWINLRLGLCQTSKLEGVRMMDIKLLCLK